MARRRARVSVRRAAAVESTMLTSLRLRHFRCYGSLRWEIPEPGALLLGENAQGKTSLIEAVCVALSLHSPRAGRLNKLAQHGCSDFGISLDTDTGTRRLVWEPRRLDMSVDGVARKDYTDYLADAPPVVWLGNKDMALVTGAAEQRREYLDFLGSQWHPEYRAHLLAYRKALKSRNLLLRHPHPHAEALRSYARVLAGHGEVLLALRCQLLELLAPHITQLHGRIAAQRQEGVELRYVPSTPLPLEEALQGCLEADLRAGFTTLGPHRDDLELCINGAAAAAYASEGQQRTLAIALILAQAGLLSVETGQAPVLLIDDIFGELDPARRQALLGALPEDSQTFITTTHLHWLEDTPLPLPVQTISGAAIQ